MLEVKNASISAGGRTLFSGLSFAVADGQTVCLTGSSGSGKTTLLRALLGFHPLDEGHISIDGELLTPSSAEEFRKHISYIPQELLLPSEWVSDMVRLPFGLKVNRGKPFSKDRLLAEWRLLELPPELYDKKTAELSGGERQRAMLAVSGLLDKSVLLLLSMDSVIETDFDCVHPNMDLGDMVKTISKSHRNVFPVVNSKGELEGIVLLDDIRNIMFRRELYHRFRVSRFMTSPPAKIRIDEPMEKVMRTFDDTKAWNLPVIDQYGKYCGFVSKSKIFNAYRDTLVKFSSE